MFSWKSISMASKRIGFDKQEQMELLTSLMKIRGKVEEADIRNFTWEQLNRVMQNMGHNTAVISGFLFELKNILEQDMVDEYIRAGEMKTEESSVEPSVKKSLDEGALLQEILELLKNFREMPKEEVIKRIEMLEKKFL